MIGQTISHYSILEKLGAGGMGVVYKAEDTRLGRLVALKFLPEGLSSDRLAVERFKREARAASGLNHPHICSVYDIGEHAGRHFIVMELMEGTALNHRIAGRPQSTDQILELGTEIADALVAAHAKGLIHRDIKPANVFITQRGQAKLLDFGLAKPGLESPREGPVAKSAAPTQENLTSSGVVVGTPAYMSPEQVRGENLDPRTDLFSLGAVLYEMATGRQPFAGSTTGMVQEAILNRAPVPAGRVNPELPAKLEEIINRTLEKDRQLRYQTASDLRADLQRLRRDTESARVAASSGVVSPGPRSGRRNRMSVLAGALAVVAVLALGTWVSLSRATGDAIDSLAVLPFTNAGGDADTEYLSDGITESLINNLSQLPNVRVKARSTVFRYKGKDADPQKAGQELGVRAVLSGRLLRRGDTLVVRAELMDIAKGSQLWGQQYNRKAADVLALQDELSMEIVAKLRLRLTGEEKQKLTKRYTRDAEAYELYLKGRYHWNKRSPDGLTKAIEYLRQAIDKDPTFALAYAGLSEAYGRSAFLNMGPPGEAMPRAKASASKALEIDGDLVEAHISLGYSSFTYDWDWPAATKHFERAMALNSAAVNSHVSYAFYLAVAGRSAEAVSVARRARDLDPVSASLSHSLAVQLFLARNFDDAIAECTRTLEIDPNYAIAHEVLGVSYAAKGMYREALPAMERAVALNPASAITLGLRAHVHGKLGDRTQALEILDQLAASIEAAIHTGTVVRHRIPWAGRKGPDLRLARPGVRRAFHSTCVPAT